MTTATKKPATSPADQRWGFPFGVDGLMTTQEACDLLRVSRYVVYNAINRGDIRRSGENKGMRLCKRSVQVYLRSQER